MIGLAASCWCPSPTLTDITRCTVSCATFTVSKDWVLIMESIMSLRNPELDENFPSEVQFGNAMHPVSHISAEACSLLPVKKRSS